ncbi:MAG: aminopeptidase [Haloferacaceae archaeon]
MTDHDDFEGTPWAGEDPVRAHAETLVDWSARVEAGDRVVVRVAEGAHDLAVAVAETLGDRGATPVFTYDSNEVSRAYARAATADRLDEPADDHALALYESADVVLSLGGARNVAAEADVPDAKRQARARGSATAREARLDTDWVSTVHPTRALAQQAGMAYEAYERFVYDAVLRDWRALADEMQAIAERLDDAAEVRIVDENTDLRLDISGRVAVNSAASVAYDSHNLPSGEVFTAPKSADGVVTFDVPMTIENRRVREVTLRFEDGEVVEQFASEGGEAVASVLETDEGARRLGEFGIGANEGITRPTDSILFDEKMAGTVHLALGRAYDACVPGGTGNESAVHVDLIRQMGEGSRLEVDGDLLQRDGAFVAP